MKVTTKQLIDSINGSGDYVITPSTVRDDEFNIYKIGGKPKYTGLNNSILAGTVSTTREYVADVDDMPVSLPEKLHDLVWDYASTPVDERNREVGFGEYVYFHDYYDRTYGA